jgi:hypothetical protein
MASARMRAVPDPEPPQPGSTPEDVILDAALKIEEMPAEGEVTEGEVIEEPAPPADGTTDQLLRSIYAEAQMAHMHASETRADIATIRKTVAGGVLVLLCVLLLASMGRKGAPTT